MVEHRPLSDFIAYAILTIDVFIGGGFVDLIRSILDLGN